MLQKNNLIWVIKTHDPVNVGVKNMQTFFLII